MLNILAPFFFCFIFNLFPNFQLNIQFVLVTIHTFSLSFSDNKTGQAMKPFWTACCTKRSGPTEAAPTISRELQPEQEWDALMSKGVDVWGLRIAHIWL